MQKILFNHGLDYQRNLEKAWELFNSDIEFEIPSVSKLVLDSWGRSRNFNVNARLNQAGTIVNNEIFQTIQDDNVSLREAARPVIKEARKVLDDNSLFMLLASNAGIILEREGNAKSLGMADSQKLIVGSNWSEQNCGTNAVGTALSLQRPVQLVAREHYCQMTKVWGCAAVPIKDLRDGRILGVLDTTGPEHFFLSMNLGWVKAMASCIEFQLSENNSVTKYRLVEEAIGRISSWKNDAIMLFDADGFFIWKSKQFSSRRRKELPKVLADASIGSRIDCMSVKRLNLDEQVEGLGREYLEGVFIDGRLAGHIFVLPNQEVVEQPTVKQANMVAEQPSLIKGISDKVGKLRVLAKKLANNNLIVTFTGETGSGKEVVSKDVHLQSGKNGRFIAVNCGAIQKELLASELFGYAEGSFSGAKKGGMLGKFEAAKDGTILLDEFCELPLDLQVYLLRVLEEREVVRIGESTARPINARIIVATNKNLEEELAAGRLREDLYYRVNATVIELPALRDHIDDVQYLFDFFMDKVSKEAGGLVPKLNDEFRAALLQHNWPGNIRELRNFAENCFLMNAGEELTLAHIPVRMKKHLSARVESSPVSDGTLKGLERDAILEALELSAGNVSKAARHLGIARSTFYKKLESLNISL
ncbi:MAG: sigma 54-interacting transcriptional regulator [Cycloclasticus sp.]